VHVRVVPVKSNGSAKYVDYLQDFNHFVDYLERHPTVGNDQTRKRTVIPTNASLDETLTRFKKEHGKLVNKAKRPSIESDFDLEAKPVRAVIPDSDNSDVPTSAATGFPLSREAGSLFRQVGREELLPKTESEELVVENHVLLGKKICIARLKAHCSDALAINLVDTNKVSRIPAHFGALESHMAKMHKNYGRKLLKSDVRSKIVDAPVSTKVNTYTDYAKLWDSSSEG
jgi:hypothetical protein